MEVLLQDKLHWQDRLHRYPVGSNWMHLSPGFIQIVDGAGRELAVYDRASVVCIRHDAAGLV